MDVSTLSRSDSGSSGDLVSDSRVSFGASQTGAVGGSVRIVSSSSDPSSVVSGVVVSVIGPSSIASVLLSLVYTV